jgi:hypothetical protein
VNEIQKAQDGEKVRDKITISARHQWLTPIILATQEAEIWRIPIQSQPGQVIPYLKKKKSKTLKIWWTVSSSRMPAWQAEAEFKSQYCKNEKKKKGHK